MGYTRMSQRRRICSGFVAAIVWAASAHTICACKSSPSETQRLGLTPFVVTGDRVEGGFRSSSGQEITAAIVTNRQQPRSLRLGFGGGSFEMRVDPTTRRVTSHGGPWKLKAVERALLREFARKSWSSARASSAEARGAMMRAAGIASFLADAPPELNNFEFTIRPPGQVDRPCCPCDGDELPQCTDCPRQCGCPGGCGPACGPEEDGQVGIRELPNACCTAVPPGADAEYQHDACRHPLTNLHGKCGWTQSADTGGRTWCQGRCGQGCIAADIYTQDCLDHDLCEGHDDPAQDCTDEWWEAADDFSYIYLLLPDPLNWCGRCPNQPCFTD